MLYSNFEASNLMDGQWHHICLKWDGRQNSGYTSYYKDGNQVKYQGCFAGPRTGGKILQLGGGRRTEEVDITGFYRWNRMISDIEIEEESNKYDGGMGGPVVQWRDFYQKSPRPFMRATSHCVVPKGKDRLHEAPYTFTTACTLRTKASLGVQIRVLTST